MVVYGIGINSGQISRHVIAIKPVKTIPGTEPDVSIRILRNGIYRTIR
jgi:hypothetical protein